MTQPTTALSGTHNFNTLDSGGLSGLQAWYSPQMMVMQLNENTQGNPAALFEDDAGIASS